MKKLTSKLVVVGILCIILLALGSCRKKEAPAAPTNLSTETYDEGIRLSWNNVRNCDYYRISVGFQIRNEVNELLDDTYEVVLCETTSTAYEDIHPFEGMNYYKVEAVNEYGNSASTVSRYYPVKEEMRMYPNPTIGNVSVRAVQISRIKILNLNGETLMDLELDCDICNLSLGELEAGVYLMQVYAENGEFFKRFVKVDGIRK